MTHPMRALAVSDIHIGAFLFSTVEYAVEQADPFFEHTLRRGLVVRQDVRHDDGIPGPRGSRTRSNASATKRE